MNKLGKKSLVDRFLNVTERVGNALPHPATLFLIFAVLALVFSGIASWLDWEATQQMADGSVRIIKPVNLLSKEGFGRILTEMVENFTGFAPLGIVMVAMLGIGIAESSGLIGAIIRMLVLSAPKRLLTFVLVFSGILSNTASDVGYVLLIPLAGVIFHSVGRHPIAGMAAAFAGVSGGFSANLILGTIDPLLAGLSQEAARIVDPVLEVNPTANMYFMMVSTFLIAFAGTFITEKLVEPRLGTYKGDVEQEDMHALTKLEKKALRRAGLVALILSAIGYIGTLPQLGFFIGPDGSVLTSPLVKGVVALLFLGSLFMGLAYGFTTGKFKSDADIMKGMSKSMGTLSSYFVLVFFAAQFVAYFKWSNLGVILAIKGATFLAAADLSPYVLMILFIIFSACINMLMGSASAKWAIMAPVFIPMFMLLGYSPELSQVVFRIGDSITNVISPMMSFFALIIAYLQKYDSRAGIGTIISTMLPYSVGFFVIWSILLIVWIFFGLPLGPGAGLFYDGMQ